VIRYDSLQTAYFSKAGGDSVIRNVDSAYVRMRLATFDTLKADSVTFEAYDVDGPGDVTAAASIVPRFTPANLLGSVTVLLSDSTLRKDSTVAIPIDTAKLIAKIKSDTATSGAPRLRVGIRITAPDSEVQVQIMTTNASPSLGATLSYLPSVDPTQTRVNIFPNSKTPDEPQLRVDLSDFQIVAVAPPPPGPEEMRIGGVPGWRGYVRFSIPPRIIDSSSVVRATLILHQHPNPQLPLSGDTLFILPYAMSASSIVNDIPRLLTFLASPEDSVKMVPRDSGAVRMEIINLVRPWRGTDTLRTPHAIALTASLEGAHAGAVEFYSNEAPDSLRPKLRISFVPRPHGGLP